MAYCTPTDLLNQMPTLIANSSPDILNTELQNLIDNEAADINTTLKRFSYPIPVSISSPRTNRDLILMFYNLLVPTAKILYRRIGEVSELRRADFLAALQIKIAEQRKSYLIDAHFDLAFSTVLPVDPLCSIDDVASYVPGYDKNSITIKPTVLAVEDYIAMESAIMYGYAAELGYITDIGSMNADQLSLYRSIVSSWSGAQLIRARIQSSGAALDTQANDLLQLAFEQELRFLDRDYDYILIA